MDFLNEKLHASNSSHSNSGVSSSSVRPVLKELNTNESQLLSPLNTAKIIASGDGGKHLPTSNALTLTSATVSGPTDRPTAFGVSPAMNAFPKELELLDDAHCSDVNKASNRFVGLTEFDEANIPELPLCVNPDIEGQVKLNFDEDFITALKPIANTAHKSTKKRAELEQFNLLLGDEPTDTALSSDSETFADCHSYRDINASNNPDNEMFGEVETFRSALKLNDGSTTSSARGQHFMDTTMENIEELAADKAPVYLDLNEAALPKPAAVVLQQQLMVGNATYEDEPMDVDMSSTMDFECGTNEAPGASVEQLKESHSVPTQGVDHSGSTASLCQAQLEDLLLEAHELKHELMLDRNVELPKNPSINILSAECVIQDNGGLESASDKVNLSVATAVEVTLPTNDLPPEGAPLELNLMLNMMCSDSNAKSMAPSSHGFPVKSATDTVHFPRSPTACVEKKMAFLEKSEYSERMSAIEAADAATGNCIIPLTSPKMAEMHAANLNETVDISEEQHERHISPVMGKESSGLNDTFVGSRTDEATAADIVDGQVEGASINNLSSGENGCTYDIESLGVTLCIEDTKVEDALNLNVSSGGTRRTFNVLDEGTPSVEDTKVENALNLNVSSGSARHTFNVLDEETPSVEDTKVENALNLNVSSGGTRRTFNVLDEGTPSMEDNKVEDALNLNVSSGGTRRTFNVLDEGTPSVEDTKVENALNLNVSSGSARHTFNVLDEGTPSVEDNKVEDALNLNVSSGGTRRTFNVLDEGTPSVEDTKVEDALNLNVSSGGTRRTFNVLDEPTASAPLPNGSPEAMKLDASASAPISMLEEQKMEAVASSSSLALSPSISTMQKSPVQQSLPLPALQKRQMSQSPPIPTIHKRQLGQAIEKSAPMSTIMRRHPDASAPREQAPLIPTVQKRPSIHSIARPFNSCATSPVELLSAKEQTQSNAMDEKDIFVDKFVTTPLDDLCAMPPMSCDFSEFGDNAAAGKSSEEEFTDADFQSGTNFILNPSDFDFLLAKGNSSVQVNRSSLLLRFDPLLDVPVPIYQPQQQQLQQLLGLNSGALISTIEEEEQQLQQLPENQQDEQQHLQQLQAALPKKHARMSIDVIKDLNIDNDCNKAFENSNSQTDENKGNFQMDELEKKIKNEVLKTEDIEKKLKDAEQREEAMIKRITEKDKTISKMNGVIESYEKTIAELVREKEQLIQNYEMQLAEVKADRDSNYHHLNSLETTFSDLHVKYEKSKEMTSQLKTSEEALITEKRQILENLRLQEQRYEKMKNHAMQQLEIANRKLESQTKEHAIESTKLKALLKKEEISRASINEQLQQKSRENTELVKICDELINGQGS